MMLLSRLGKAIQHSRPGLAGWLVLAAVISAGTPAARGQHVVPVHLAPFVQLRTSPQFNRDAVQHAIASIESSMATYRQQRQCFSCHHHAHPIMALTELAKRGLVVDTENLEKQLQVTWTRTREVRDRYQNGHSIGGGVDTTGYTLLALKVRNQAADSTTEAMIDWLLDRDRETTYWTGTRTRPPTQTSDLTRAWLCIEALNHYADAKQQTDANHRIRNVAQWISQAAAPYTEDQVSRLRALAAIGHSEREVSDFATQLIDQQRPDGGWSQTPRMPSDAYATGSVLMALHQAAGLAVDHSAYQRGVQYLRSTQLADGTWHVVTRAQPVQVYFESGFPHGRDQFISMTATCWAATAIGLTLPPIDANADESRVVR